MGDSDSTSGHTSADIDAMIAGSTVSEKPPTFTIGTNRVVSPVTVHEDTDAPKNPLFQTSRSLGGSDAPLVFLPPPVPSSNRTSDNFTVSGVVPDRTELFDDIFHRLRVLEGIVRGVDDDAASATSSDSYQSDDESSSDISSDDSNMLTVPEDTRDIYNEISDLLDSGDDWLMHSPYVHEKAGNIAIAFHKADAQSKIRSNKILDLVAREKFVTAYHDERCRQYKKIIDACVRIKASVDTVSNCNRDIISLSSNLEASMARTDAAELRSRRRMAGVRSAAATIGVAALSVVTVYWSWVSVTSDYGSGPTIQ